MTRNESWTNGGSRPLSLSGPPLFWFAPVPTFWVLEHQVPFTHFKLQTGSQRILCLESRIEGGLDKGFLRFRMRAGDSTPVVCDGCVDLSMRGEIKTLLSKNV